MFLNVIYKSLKIDTSLKRVKVSDFALSKFVKFEQFFAGPSYEQIGCGDPQIVSLFFFPQLLSFQTCCDIQMKNS